MSHVDSTVDSGAEEPSLWHNHNFQRFFLGQFVTNAGDSLYTVAVLWLIYDLSGSTVLTGLANSILLLPWLLQILAGPFVDRLSLKPVLVGSQVVQGLVVLVIPTVAITGTVTVGVVFAVIPVLMVCSLAMAPMKAALLPRIVAEEHLSSANSAVATVTLGLDMLFDALSGLFIALFGVTVLFVVDSLTFAIAAVLFVGITLSKRTDGDERTSGESDDSDGTTNSDGTNDPDDSGESLLGTYRSDLREGIAILRGTVFVELVLLTAVANFATGVTLAILPAFGGDIGGPAIYGLLLGALGMGRLVGSLVAPWFETVGYGRLLLVGNSLAAGCWLGAVLVPSTVLTVVLFGLAWIPAGIAGVLTSTLNQTMFPTDMLGRVSSIKGTAAGATLPVGSLLGGIVAAFVGTTTTMGLAAFGFGFTGGYVLFRGRIRTLPSVANAGPADFDVRIGPDR